MLKSFLDILAIASNVITVALFLFNFFAIKNLPMRKKVFSNPYFKVFLYSMIFTGIVFCLPLLCPYFCPACVQNTDTVTVVKHDTLTFRKDSIIYRTVYVKAKTPQMSQKNDNGGSGVQNNGINNGQQAGRDINNYGILPRDVHDEDMIKFFQNFPDKHTRIGFKFLSSPDGEMLAYKSKITQILRNHGYDNIGEKVGFSMTIEMPKTPMIDPQADGSVYIDIPPAQ